MVMGELGGSASVLCCFGSSAGRRLQSTVSFEVNKEFVTFSFITALPLDVSDGTGEKNQGKELFKPSQQGAHF